MLQEKCGTNQLNLMKEKKRKKEPNLKKNEEIRHLFALDLTIKPLTFKNVSKKNKNKLYTGDKRKRRS